MRKTDRSRILAYQLCRRKRWLEYELMRRGLEPVYTSYDLAIGLALHHGAEEMLRSRSEEPLPYLEASLEKYRKMVPIPSPGHEALIAALLYAYRTTQLPNILANFLVVAVEREMSHPLTPNLEMMGRADAFLRSIDGGYTSVYSIKSTQEFKQRNLNSAYVDLQGLSESWLGEKEMGVPIDFIQMHYFIKGAKQSKDKLEPEEIPQYKSPLIYGYRRLIGTEYEYAHSYYYTCTEPHEQFSGKGKHLGKCPGGKNHRLTDDWQPFKVWESMPLLEWLERPQIQRILADQFAFAPPISRSPQDMVRWERTAIALESEVDVGSQACHKTLLENPSELELMLDIYFPRDFGGNACNQQYGKKCPFFDICHGSAGEDPLSNGYQWRTFNHPQEQEA